MNTKKILLEARLKKLKGKQTENGNIIRKLERQLRKMV